MKVPFKYSLKNVFARRLTMALTVLGIMLVSFIFAAVLMMANGVRQVLASSGSPENVVVIRESSNTEIQSFVSRYQAGIIQTLPEIAAADDGTALVTGELVVLINKNIRGTKTRANISVRGISAASMKVHKNIKLISGRMLEFGKTEIIVGKKASERFENCGLGQTITFSNTDWNVVGVFESDGSSFESEIWGDVNQFLPAFGRPVFSSMTFTMRDTSEFSAMRDRVKADPRMTVDLKQEDVYYADQSRTLVAFIEILGIFISIAFSLGAIIGAMITMYAAVANRTREIATMRALGFKRRNILIAFMAESITISILGGALGVLAASLLQTINISTINWDTFSDLSFSFTLSSSIIIQVIIFALVMGFLGGFLPAVRASRIKITEALRAE